MPPCPPSREQAVAGFCVLEKKAINLLVMGFINADRRQIDLIGYSVDEFVDDGSLCRVIAGIVERLDLSDLYSVYSRQGGDAFDSGAMLTIWLLDYSEGQTSTRRVEQLCRRDLHYIYASANLRPDHTI